MLTTNEIARLGEMARKLRNNRIHIPHGEPVNGKYAKSYHSLKAGICSLANRIMKEEALSGIHWDYAPGALVADVNKLLQQISKAAGGALFDADMERFAQLVSEAKVKVWEAATHYREECCQLWITPACWQDNGDVPYFYCPLTDEFLTGYHWSDGQVCGGTWGKCPELKAAKAA